MKHKTDNDHLLGDADYIAQYLWEDSERYSINNTDWYHSRADTYDWTITAGGTPDAPTVVFSPVFGESNPVGGAADSIYAGAGDDKVWAGDGDDYVAGEAGNDTLSGDAGSDVILGGTGDDKLWGDDSKIDISRHGNDFLDGGEGNDQLYGQGGDDSLFGGAGDDQLFGDDTGQTIAGNNYLKTLKGSASH